MAGAQIGTSVTILSSGLKGWQAVSLTNFSGSAVSAIAAGSTVEIAGAFFIFGSEESVTGFSSISTAATAYVALTPSGTAGSQIVDAAWTSTAPTWSESKQGWYASAASVVRYVGGGVKTGTTALEPKWVLTQEGQNRRSDGGLTVPVNLSVLGNAAVTGGLAVTGIASATTIMAGNITGNPGFISKGVEASINNAANVALSSLVAVSSYSVILNVCAAGWGEAIYFASIRTPSTHIVVQNGEAFGTTNVASSFNVYWGTSFGGHPQIEVWNRTGAARKVTVGLFQSGTLT
jgi:hypothetical protein